MLDVNGQAIGDGTLELIKFAETASAVNEITITNADTTNAPEISATGDDTDIDLKLTPKGDGKLDLDGIKFPNADGTAGQALVTDGSGVLSFATAGLAWQSVQTADFTAVKGEAYPVNTTSDEITVTLPATPSAGDQVQLVDYAGTFDTNALVIDPNGEDIEGGALNLQLTGEREGVILTYIDSTQGWIATSGINEGTDALSPVPYDIDFLVVAGGGGGAGGGAGAGGYRTSTQSVSIGTVITVTVGDGGSAGLASVAGGNTAGSNSSISGGSLTTITSAGGGRAGFEDSNGFNGGSGGGAGSAGGSFTGGSGNTPSTSPSQGNNGGSNGGGGGPSYPTGGGGGASAVGVDATYTPAIAGNGGAGTASSITGSSVTYAGGGGGGSYFAPATAGTGGTGGGGNGAVATGTATAGTVNLGGGGGGTGLNGTAGAGGKGVVILAMPLASFSNTTTGSPTESDDGTTKVLIFNGDGSYTA
jgi:hypothetical protein